MSAVFNPVQAMSAFLLHDPHVAPALATIAGGAMATFIASAFGFV